MEVTLPARGKLEVRKPLLEPEAAGRAVAGVRAPDDSGRALRRRLVHRAGGSSARFTLPPGLYEVRLSAPDGRTWSDLAEVRDHETTVVVLE